MSEPPSLTMRHACNRIGSSPRPGNDRGGCLLSLGVTARKSQFGVGLHDFDAIKMGMRLMSAFTAFPFTAIRPSIV